MREPGGVRLRDRIGTPHSEDAARVLLLGAGELGREIAIEAVRLGAEVIAVDRYSHAPAMQVAQRHHVLPMTDGKALRAVIEAETPDVIVPEIEQIDTGELERLESEGWTVIPTAAATRATMDRERIRRLASEVARVPTSRFGFADSLDEARRVARDIGLPCVFKAITSSSGHGMTVVRDIGGVDAAYRSASLDGRVQNPRVMIEAFLTFDKEVTALTLRHHAASAEVATTVLAPIGHARPGTLYHESWQPADLEPSVTATLAKVASSVTNVLGGVGVYGVECFVAGSEVYFSEVSPRPHDTGLVTLASQWNSEFALHARAILGFPYAGPEPTVPSAAHVILSAETGPAPTYGGVGTALSTPGVRIFLFGKPDAYPDRRLGVAVARGRSTQEARGMAERAAHAVEAEIRIDARTASRRAPAPS